MDNSSSVFIDLLIRSVEHQLASPLVAASGYLEMACDSSLSLSPRQKASMTSQSHDAIERAIDMLGALQQLQQLARTEPKIISANLHFNSLVEMTRDVDIDTLDPVEFSIDRTYRLPLVLVDPYVFEEILGNIVDFFVLSRRISKVAISFRNRDGELIVKFDGAEQLHHWLPFYREFWQGLESNHQLVDTSSPVMHLIMAQLQLEKMGGEFSFVQVRRSPAAIYLHLPLASQLYLPVFPGK